jgi:hypothetical protein
VKKEPRNWREAHSTFGLIEDMGLAQVNTRHLQQVKTLPEQTSLWSDVLYALRPFGVVLVLLLVVNLIASNKDTLKCIAGC